MFFEFNKNNNAKEVLLLDNDKKTKTLTEIISTYKGKVVYIDFWASWCAPCRKAMPSSRELHEKYINKDIVFLFISIDTDFDKWEIAANKEKLAISGGNFLAVNYPNASLYKELQLKTIPRYLIYDKNGKLVHQNAPSPDSDQVINELDKYLKE